MPSDLKPAISDRTERLLALLARQKSLVDQLLALAAGQEDAVSKENAEALLELLGRRQVLIDRVMAAQTEIAPLLPQHAGRGATADAMPQQDRQRAARLIEEIETGLAEVMKRDEAANEAIRSIQDRARSAIKTFGRTQQARRAYAPQRSPVTAAPADPRFSDRKG